MTGYVLNCFLLVVPVLLLNLVFAGHLPPGYQPSQWNDVPAAVTVPENALRILVMALPLLLPITIGGTAHLVGLLLYLAGLAAYATGIHPGAVAGRDRPDRHPASDRGAAVPSVGLLHPDCAVPDVP
jgi:hypothetical protein